MRTILVIGIGTGNPEHVTVQAIGAMNRADVFFVLDKGPAAAELNHVRDGIIARFVTHPHRVVAVTDPTRDRRPGDYAAAVADWHAARASVLAEAITGELGEDGCGAFLVWGDPALYDSTLRILDAVRAAGAAFRCEVIPGIASPLALAAAHRMVLNRVGEPLRITTARRLAAEPPREGESVIVMLDDGSALDGLDDACEVWWGARLGMPDEAVIAGRVGDVHQAITERRRRLREAKGWIMDICLIRRPRPPDRSS